MNLMLIKIYTFSPIKKQVAIDIAQQVKAPTVKSNYLSLIPRTHMVE